VKLKEAVTRQRLASESGTFIAVLVCRELLMSKSVEWIPEIGQDPQNPSWHQQTLMFGEEASLGPQGHLSGIRG
jgi:hypothetical protein